MCSVNLHAFSAYFVLLRQPRIRCLLPAAILTTSVRCVRASCVRACVRAVGAYVHALRALCACVRADVHADVRAMRAMRAMRAVRACERVCRCACGVCVCARACVRCAR